MQAPSSATGSFRAPGSRHSSALQFPDGATGWTGIWPGKGSIPLTAQPPASSPGASSALAQRRRLGQVSVLGTYLDPLADKVLICCVAGALGIQGLLPPPLVALIIGEASPLEYACPGSAADPAPACNITGKDVVLVAGTAYVTLTGKGAQLLRRSQGRSEEGPGQEGPLPAVKPALVSKANTCLQLGLVGVCLAQGMLGHDAVPDSAVQARVRASCVGIRHQMIPMAVSVQGLAVTTAATTLASVLVYARRPGAYMGGASR